VGLAVPASQDGQTDRSVGIGSPGRRALPWGWEGRSRLAGTTSPTLGVGDRSRRAGGASPPLGLGSGQRGAAARVATLGMGSRLAGTTSPTFAAVRQGAFAGFYGRAVQDSRMNVILTPHNVTLTKAIEDHLVSRIEKLEHLDHFALKIRVILERDQTRAPER